MPNAVSALFYLWSRSTLNMVRVRLRRLREPKYLLGASIALAYFSFVLIGPLRTRAAREARRAATDASDLAPETAALVFTSMATFFLLGAFLVLWLWRRARTSLAFTEAEIAFLFPGPVRHATLVHYSLIRNQLAAFLSALFITAMTMVWSLPSPWWARLIGWWLMLSVLSLHVLGSGFVLTRLLDHGIAQWQRQLGALLLFVLVVALCNYLDPGLHLPNPGEMSPPEDFAAYLYDQVRSGPLYWLLAPLRAVTAPFVAADAAAFFAALVAALIVYAAHYAWVFLAEIPDAETAIAQAQKRAAQRAALQKGNLGALRPPAARRAPFRLAAQGSPVMALLWKNLLSTRDYIRLRTALVLAALMIAWDLWTGIMPQYGFLSALPALLALVIGSQVLMFGAQLARQDLRMDLENADLIKTWPLQGWQVVLGELLAPTVILTGMLWLCLLQLGLAAESPRQPWVTPELRLAVGLSLALVLPFLCAMQLLIANAAVVLFPAWAKATAGQQNMGFELMGQRMLFMSGQLLVTLAALVPALLAGVVMYIPVSWFTEIFALLPAALTVALVLAAELAWGINWLGERFDSYDLSQ